MPSLKSTIPDYEPREPQVLSPAPDPTPDVMEGPMGTEFLERIWVAQRARGRTKLNADAIAAAQRRAGRTTTTDSLSRNPDMLCKRCGLPSVGLVAGVCGVCDPKAGAPTPAREIRCPACDGSGWVPAAD